MQSFLKKILIYLLTLEARLVLARQKPVVIAVTGTVGKTAAKDAIAAALAPFAAVRKSAKSYNSELGVPLAILGAHNQWHNPLGWFFVLVRGLFLIFKNPPPAPSFRKGGGQSPVGEEGGFFLVLEVGTDRPGDIRAIARWLRPHAVVVTKLSRAPVHIENFLSVGDLIAEKGALVSALRAGGALILNSDDRDVLVYRALAPHDARLILYGFGGEADVRPDAPRELFSRLQFRPHAYAALAGLAAARAFGYDTLRAAEAIARATRARGRLCLLEGVNGSHIIDDSYNSSPVAVAEALCALSEVQANGRRIAVLGDMLELGSMSAAEHEKMIREAVRAAALVFVIGDKTRAAAYAAARNPRFPSEKIRTFPDARAAGEALAKELRAGDVALVKGSQGMRMERAVFRILRDPARASELLVRQEKEWQKRA